MRLPSLVFLTMILTTGYGQETVEENRAGYHRLTLVMSHTHVPEGVKGEDREWLVLASWSLDYDYWFHPNWAIGLHSDLIVENFEVEEYGNEENILKRSRPVAPALMGLYKPGKNLTILLGAGGEYSREETFFLIRTGLEYGWELEGEWELGVNLTGDFKVDAYNSWSLGIGISKILLSGKK